MVWTRNHRLASPSFPSRPPQLAPLALPPPPIPLTRPVVATSKKQKLEFTSRTEGNMFLKIICHCCGAPVLLERLAFKPAWSNDASNKLLGLFPSCWIYMSCPLDVSPPRIEIPERKQNIKQYSSSNKPLSNHVQFGNKSDASLCVA